MPTEATFRFSTYLTLALACAAIGYAEHELLPEVVAFAALAVVGLGVLYFMESRVTLLSIPAANRLGLVIGIVFLAWVGYRVKREMDTMEFVGMGWQMLGVAMLGVLLMMVIVGKVARGEKHAGDYWTLHGIALTGVGLSGALAQDPVCFALIGLYLLAAAWSLSLFHLNRAAGVVPPIPNASQKPPPVAAVVSSEPYGRLTGFRVTLMWTAAAAAVVVPLYLLTPRSDAQQADFGKPRIEIGYAADQMVDLTRTGPLKANSEVAFEVTATHADGSPKTDLSPHQRWRGTTRRRYASGGWQLSETRLPSIAPTATNRTVWSPPDLGPGQFTLTFEVPARLRTPFLADPVVWVPDQPPPMGTKEATFVRSWLAISDGSFHDTVPRQRGQSYHHVQAYRVGEEHDLSPPFRLVGPNPDEALAPLRNNPVPRVKEYADRVLAEMIAAGRLPADCRDPVRLLPKPEYHDAIARGFSDHLSTAPGFRYTTDLKRERKNIDPVEDFLFHSKAGHCERYATALALMLRSQGVPAVFVLGFKGCEHQGDGRYVVRQEHAHAWVEALVSQPGPEGRLGGPPVRVFRWRSLDPSPAGDDAANADDTWWRQAGSWMQSRFDAYVKDYTPEKRHKALADFVAWVSRPQTLAVLGGVAALALGSWVVLWRRRRPPAPKPEVIPEPTRWFGELVALLAAHGLVPAPGDTAREFAETASAALRQRPACAGVADVPLAWAEAYYQDRFGGHAPSDARLAELEAGLESLRQALGDEANR
jgi:hypothetical protein